MASKLIVNEIEHTDPASAVIMAKATIADATLTAGTLGSGVTGGSGLTALGTVATGNISNTSIVYPAGHILQIVDSKKTDTSSRNASSWGDIGGTDQAGAGSIWCCKITPNATSSKILVCAGISYGRQNGNLSANFLWFRDSTQIFKGDAASNRNPSWCGGYGNSDHWNQVASVQFLDSPNTTSQVTYKVQFRSEASSYYTWINRGHNDSDSSGNGWRGASVITLMEVAG